MIKHLIAEPLYMYRGRPSESIACVSCLPEALT